MSKSTTGAYGDFPDYYYESGNQFAAFLLGKTPKRSWDTRMEATLVAGGGPIVFGSDGPRGVVRRPKPKPELSAHDELMIYARGMLSRKGAANVLNSLAAARGVVEVPALRDPYDALDRFALQHLSESELRTILERMRGLARRPPLRKTKHAPRRAKPKPVAPSPRARQSKPRKERPTTPASCAICGRDLSEDEKGFWARHLDYFLTQGYCREDGTKLLAVFGATPRSGP